MHTSTIQVLKVEREEKQSRRTGNKYMQFAARCILVNDDGTYENVATLRSDFILPELRDSVEPGTYRAAFGIRVPDYGEYKGDMVMMLTGLIPVPPGKQAAAPAPAAKGA